MTEDTVPNKHLICLLVNNVGVRMPGDDTEDRIHSFRQSMEPGPVLTDCGLVCDEWLCIAMMDLPTCPDCRRELAQ